MDHELIRQEIRAFSLERAEGPHRDTIPLLYQWFDELNEAYWDGEMEPVPIMVLEPKSTKAYADASEFSGFGCRYQVRMRPACVTGEFPIGAFSDEPRPGWRMHPGHDLADRHRWLRDVVLHEMVHQRLNQIDHPERHKQGGHGPAFTDESNRIGQMMNLPSVKCRGRKGKDFAFSAQWPLCVRPGGMYGHYYGDLWEYVPDQSKPASQFDKLCEAYEELAAVWQDPRTTHEDKARFMARYGLGQKPSDGGPLLVTTSHDMELAA